MATLPLSLYVHVPWCVRKCPYCDFNSHTAPLNPPQTNYIDALLSDLSQDIARFQPTTPLSSIFIGGGTPSLFDATAIDTLLRGIRERIDVRIDAEITLEANPGTADAAGFEGYLRAGVNRLSIGVQSLSDPHLKRLERIHDATQARGAVSTAHRAGFDNINLDLMYGLPKQTLSQSRRDIEDLIELNPQHISYYQLTLEPNTAFHHNPPEVPDSDLVADMHTQGFESLRCAGFFQYEVSAYGRPGRQCRHNLNYWRFGDYLGIGAGAHGKISRTNLGQVARTWKLRHPDAYLAATPDRRIQGERILEPEDLILEFAMNALRLTGGFPANLFSERTGLPIDTIKDQIASAAQAGLLETDEEAIRPTPLGRTFLNDALQHFATG